MKIEGRILLFDVIHADGSLMPPDCKIDIPEKVPIVKDFEIGDPNSCIGSASVSIDDRGLVFTGDIQDDFDTDGYPGCGGYYVNVGSSPGIKFKDERYPYARTITSMSLKCIGLVKHTFCGYKYKKEIENE